MKTGRLYDGIRETFSMLGGVGDFAIATTAFDNMEILAAELQWHIKTWLKSHISWIPSSKKSLIRHWQ
jgi:hypothetical protein